MTKKAATPKVPQEIRQVDVYGIVPDLRHRCDDGMVAYDQDRGAST